jgi:hypothetical protein
MQCGVFILEFVTIEAIDPENDVVRPTGINEESFGSITDCICEMPDSIST